MKRFRVHWSLTSAHNSSRRIYWWALWKFKIHKLLLNCTKTLFACEAPSLTQRSLSQMTTDFSLHAAAWFHHILLTVLGSVHRFLSFFVLTFVFLKSHCLCCCTFYFSPSRLFQEPSYQWIKKWTDFILTNSFNWLLNGLILIMMPLYVRQKQTSPSASRMAISI